MYKVSYSPDIIVSQEQSAAEMARDGELGKKLWRISESFVKSKKQ